MLFPPYSERFWAKVDTTGPDDCWLWLGHRNREGYGKFAISNGPFQGQFQAHRFAYLDNGGVIPEGFQIDHLCRIAGCVNPAHLEPVTSRENTLRGIASRGGRRVPRCHLHGDYFGPKCARCYQTPFRGRLPRIGASQKPSGGRTAESEYLGP